MGVARRADVCWRGPDGTDVLGDVAVLGATTELAIRSRAAKRDGVAADYGEAYKLRLYAAAGVQGTPLVLEQGGRVGRAFLAAVRRAVSGASGAAVDVWASVSAALARGNADILNAYL